MNIAIHDGNGLARSLAEYLEPVSALTKESRQNADHKNPLPICSAGRASLYPSRDQIRNYAQGQCSIPIIDVPPPQLGSVRKYVEHHTWGPVAPCEGEQP